MRSLQSSVSAKHQPVRNRLKSFLTPALLDPIKVTMEGVPVPLSSVGQVMVKDANTLIVTCFEAKAAHAVSQAIAAAGKGLAAAVDGMKVTVGQPR